ncbi:MAG: hypothetical protein ACI85I_002777 [Arenicella sp.]|jgi:hypothetical protein
MVRETRTKENISFLRVPRKKNLFIGKPFKLVVNIATSWVNSDDLLASFGNTDFFSSINK